VSLIQKHVPDADMRAAAQMPAVASTLTVAGLAVDATPVAT
jgi:hypothetical protein